MKKALVCGAGGFIGSHVVKELKKAGYFVRGVDIKHPEFSPTEADDFMIKDLRKQCVYDDIFCDYYDEVFQFAADIPYCAPLSSGLWQTLLYRCER